MCGIAGIVGNVSALSGKDIVTKMTAAMSYRGPDDSGCWSQDHITLGHRRLSIIDLGGGHQPMVDEKTGNVIVFNGEIYNFNEIRAELIRNGERFVTSSDTEVILKAYSIYKEQCLQKFNGMFVFALWDYATKKLFIARDRLGVKPLYYSIDKQTNSLYFSSEFKPIADVITNKTINDSAFIDYMNFLYIPTPHTIFNQIMKFPQATYGVWENGVMQFHLYWNPWDIPAQSTLNVNELRDELDSKLHEAVRLRLVSDVPLGAFLSGGIDSSAVVAHMAELTSTPVKTFTIGFEADPDNELDDARLISKLYGTEHYEQIITPLDIPEILAKIVAHFGEPFADSSAVPTYFVSALARGHVTVALSGDGGDELFAGYNAYRYYKTLYDLKKYSCGTISIAGKAFRFLPRNITRKSIGVTKVRSFLEKYDHTLAQQWSVSRSVMSRGSAINVFSRDMRARMLSKQWNTHLGDYFRENSPADIVGNLTRVDMQTYLPDDLLVKVDRMSMAASLEVRSPFLDYKLLEFTLTIPSTLKLNHSAGKLILKDSLKKRLPTSVLNKKKQGFVMPMEKWFRNGLQNYLAETLLEGKSVGYFFDKKGIEDVIQEHTHGKVDHDDLLWAMLIFEKWYENHTRAV